MKVLVLTNEGVSADLINWLKVEALEEVSVETEKISTDSLKVTEAEFIVSYNYRYIIKEDVLNLFPRKAVNLHISLLPWNKGSDPNFWSIVEDSPKGVTIHFLDKGVDTGPILVQKEISFEDEIETLSSTYGKLHDEIQEMFKAHWNQIKTNKITAKPQVEEGSVHYRKEFTAIEEILGSEGWNVPIPVLMDRYNHLENE